MSQVVPTEPGWWWVEADGYETVIEVWEEVDYDAPRCSPRRGFVCSVDDERLADGVDGCDVSDGESVPAIVWLAPVAKHEEVERLRAVVAELAEHIEYTGEETLTVTLADLLNVSPSRVPSSLRTLGGAQ